MAHRVGCADEIAEGVLAADLLPQNPVFALNAEFFDGALKQVAQDIRVNRLDEIIVGAAVDDL